MPLRSGAHHYFVNSSVGSDSNGCSGAQQPSAPLKTIAAGVACVAAGSGDQVLIAEGTRYAEALPWLSYKGGFDAGHPTVIESYDPSDPMNDAKYGRGDQRGARPVLTAPQALISGAAASFIAIRGLDFNPGNVADASLMFRGQISYLLIENNLLRYTGISYDHADAAHGTHLVIRNNSLYGQWNTVGRTGGVYADGVDGVTLEDNVIYHAGWKIGVSRDTDLTLGGPTMFSHPIYLQTGTTGGLVRRNLIMDGAADGGIARGDILWTENVTIRCPSGTGLGGGPTYTLDRPNGVSIEASYNLSLAAIDMTSTDKRGYGYTTSNGIAGSRVHHNLLIFNTVENEVGGNANTFSNSAPLDAPSYMAFEDNVSFNWTQPGGTYFTQTGTLAGQVHTSYDRNKWDDAASGTNTSSRLAVLPTAYTEAALYAAVGYADYNALIADMIEHPEKHVQRTFRTLAFTGYGM